MLWIGTIYGGECKWAEQKLGEREVNCNLLEISAKSNVVCGKRMNAQVTLEMIYDEVRRVNERLSLIEDVIEEVVVKGLPEMSVGKKKIKEIERSIQEMKKGSCITLEELRIPP